MTDHTAKNTSVEALRRHYNSEEAHSVFVERLASRIFQETYRAVGLSAEDHELLSTAAILHDIGIEEDPEAHNMRSREILLEGGLAGFSPERLTSIACIVTFHRKKVRWEEDELFLSLGRNDRERVLKLSAILRVADGLDYTHGQSVAIDRVDCKEDAIVIHVSDGAAYLGVDVERANKKADLWQEVMPVPVDIVMSDTDGKPKKKAPKVKGRNTVRKAAAKILGYHLGCMQANEGGTRAGEDIEALHDMRVATRRLRAALRTFRKRLGPDALEPFRSELKWVAGALGEVRDLDVWIEHLENYVQDAPSEDRHAIENYIAAEKGERETLRAKMISVLDSERFRALERGFESFLQEELPDLDASAKVGPFAAKSIRKRVKDLLEFVPDVAAASDEELHRLRILGKRLRYTGEFFAGCFGKNVNEMIQMMREVQDALGALHDTIVWRGRIGETDSAPLQRLKDYLTREGEEAREDFLGVWSCLTSKRFQKALRKELKSAAP